MLYWGHILSGEIGLNCIVGSSWAALAEKVGQGRWQASMASTIQPTTSTLLWVEVRFGKEKAGQGGWQANMASATQPCNTLLFHTKYGAQLAFNQHKIRQTREFTITVLCTCKLGATYQSTEHVPGTCWWTQHNHMKKADPNVTTHGRGINTAHKQRWGQSQPYVLNVPYHIGEERRTRWYQTYRTSVYVQYLIYTSL